MKHTDFEAKFNSENVPMFKQCPSCETVWYSRNSFLDDPEIYLIGYQAGFKNLTRGLFYFNHSCKSTMTLYVHEFEALYEGPVYKKKMTGLDNCPGHCLHKNNLEPCPAECECAYVREVVQVIKDWKKERK